MPTAAMLDGIATSIEIAGRAPLRLCIDGRTHIVFERPAATPGAFAIIIDGVRHEGWRCRVGQMVHVRLAGRSSVIELADPTASAIGAAATEHELRAPLPGIVLELRTTIGAVVRRGETLLLIESMKVQMALPAPCDGVVEAIHAVPNTAFDRTALLVALRPGA